MNGRRRRHVLGAALGLAAGPGWPGSAAAFAWPEIELLDGTRIPPTAWNDMAAVIVFWATWCSFCRRHNQHVEALHRSVSGRRLQVLGVALDHDPTLVRRHVQQHGYTFPITMQAALRSPFGLRRVTPLTVAIDRLGRARAPIPGEMFEEDVLELSRLAERPA